MRTGCRRRSRVWQFHGIRPLRALASSSATARSKPLSTGPWNNTVRSSSTICKRRARRCRSMCAASRLYGRASTHAFIDGNKRTAFVVCRTLIELNGGELDAGMEGKYPTFPALGEGRVSETEPGPAARVCWLAATVTRDPAVTGSRITAPPVPAPRGGVSQALRAFGTTPAGFGNKCPTGPLLWRAFTNGRPVRGRRSAAGHSASCPVPAKRETR